MNGDDSHSYGILSYWLISGVKRVAMRVPKRSAKNFGSCEFHMKLSRLSSVCHRDSYSVEKMSK